MSNATTFPNPDLKTALYLLDWYRENTIELLETLHTVMHLNSRGKTKEIADLCDIIIKRNEKEDI
jgi:hypothetical protein